MDYLIIAENDESKWNDQTGVKYHFPSKYKNKIIPGSKVIYYKGGIKNKKYLNKRLSDKPHYFGIGEIGDVYQDSENKKDYYADIEGYIPFNEAVPFKIDGEYIENKVMKNYFRDGVRVINEDIYKRIIKLAQLDVEIYKNITYKDIKQKVFPNIDSIKITEKESTLERKLSNRELNTIKEDNCIYHVNIYSNNSKNVGDRAEEIVKKYLEEKGMINVRWIAVENEKPGYDISCKDKLGNDLFIEVKGTTANKFTGFILTKNELNAAKIYKNNYYIYFVTDCTSDYPAISIVKNPYSKFEKGEWKKECMQYHIEIV